MRKYIHYFQYKRWSITIIMYASFLFMIVVPVLLITYIAARSYHLLLVETVTSRATTTLQLVSYSVDTEAERIMRTLNSILKDNEVSSSLLKAHTMKDMVKNNSGLDQQLSNYFHQYEDNSVSAVFFYKESGMYYYNQQFELNEKDVRESTWYKSTVTNKNKIQLFGNKKNTQAVENLGFDGTSITASISPGKNGRFYDDIELILFGFPDSILQQYLQSQVSKSGELLILNESGSLLVSGNQSFANKGFEDDGLFEAKRNQSGNYITNINGQDVFVVYLTSNQGWKYIRIIPYDRFMKKINAVNEKSLVVGLVGITAFLFVSYFIVQSIVRPVLATVRQMKAMKTGNFEVQIEERGPFEVYVLGKTFNEMVLRMKELIEEIGQKEKQKKDAEITALQSQINPHFLLNTLNTIKLMAVISKAKHIQQMTESLTKILSSSFNRGGMYSTIREEMELLDHYFTIMKIRYGDTFDVVIKVDPHIVNLYILKLLLQPIVENSIIHGVQQLEKRGVIEITGELAGADCIRFQIKDNGIGFADLSGDGMTDTAPEHINERFNGIGISNVLDRIYLNYGPKYGLQIESKPGEGTTITIQLPVLQEPLRSRIQEGNHFA